MHREYAYRRYCPRYIGIKSVSCRVYVAEIFVGPGARRICSINSRMSQDCGDRDLSGLLGEGEGERKWKIC